MKYQILNHKKLLIILSVFIILIIGLIYFNTKRNRSVVEEAGKRGEEIVTASVIPTAAIANNSMFLVVNPKEVKSGDSIKVVVAFHAPGKILAGSDVIVQFDPIYLQAAGEIMPAKDGYFSSFPRKEVNNQTGLVKVTAFGGKNENLASPGTIFFLTFKAKKTGKTEIKIDYQPGTTNHSTLVEKGTSKNILEGVNNATLEIKL